MAEFALHGRTSRQRSRIRNMLGRFRYWRYSLESLIVVAQCAVIDDTGMVHRRSRERREICWRVAHLACQSSCKVG